MKAWPISEVCRMSGTTSRTLRHYDRIGLLAPARTGPGGIRYYGPDELLRLQRVLVMRELGLGLADIARVLDQGRNEAEALYVHLDDLLAERDRVDTLIATVRRTIDTLKEAGTLFERPEDLFAGFDPDYYAGRARHAWLDQWHQARRAVEGMSDQGRARLKEEAAGQMARMAALMAEGRPVEDPTVQAEVHAHYLAVLRLWTPDGEAFAHLGRTYAEEGPWRTVYERVAPGLADYQRDAMAVYARQTLTEENEEKTP